MRGFLFLPGGFRRLFDPLHAAALLDQADRSVLIVRELRDADRPVEQTPARKLVRVVEELYSYLRFSINRNARHSTDGR